MLVSMHFPILSFPFLPIGLCILIGVSIYTAQFTDSQSVSQITLISSHHGYSFILAWICFCFSFIIGILYLVLRKK